MAVIANAHPAVAAPLPGSIGIRHHMTVHTGFGGIGKIGDCIGNANQKDAQTPNNAQKNKENDLPPAAKGLINIAKKSNCSLYIVIHRRSNQVFPIINIYLCSRYRISGLSSRNFR
jgi:hypothetical protein